MRADFVGLRVIEIGFGGGDVFEAIAALGFFSAGARFLERGPQFLVVEGNQDLARLDGIAFADQHFVDAAADFGTYTYVAGFDGAGAFEAGVAVEPAGIEPRGGQHGSSSEKNQDALAAHETSLLSGTKGSAAAAPSFREALSRTRAS